MPMRSSTGGGTSHGHHGHHHSEPIGRTKYQNNAPDLPFEPKSLLYPFDPNRYIHFKSTSLEKNFKWEILNEQDLGVRIDLINQDYNRVDPHARLNIKDEKLLEEETTSAADIKRAEQHNKLVSWMRRNEYISSENTRFQPKQYDAAEAKVGYSIKRKLKEVDFYKDRESQMAAIDRSFEAAKKPIEKHYSKPNVYAVEEYPILPDYEMWKHPCAQVIFDDDPAPRDHPVTQQNEEMSQALIKGLVDKDGEQFVAYFLPTEETLKKRHRDDENDLEYFDEDEYQFKLTREYTWVIKSKVNSGYEENLYFIMKNDGVFYNELETRVRLSKRRTKANKVGNTKLNVRYRPFTKQELKNQRMRARELEPTIEEEEEEEEDDEDEGNNHEADEINHEEDENLTSMNKDENSQENVNVEEEHEHEESDTERHDDSPSNKNHDESSN